MKLLTQSKNTTILLVLIPLACFALSPQARAVCQEGCDPFQNTFLGNDALINNFGSGNTAVGSFALFSNTSGNFNTALGAALFSNTTGTNNTALGDSALYDNTTGHHNTATGFNTLLHNNGNFNTATGSSALNSNTTGEENTATGHSALVVNSTGNNNTATGSRALLFNEDGSENTATGSGALETIRNGSNNTAEGANALQLGTSGNDNTAIGFNALLNANGSSNIALGSNAGVNLTRGSGNIYIGSPGGSSDERWKIRIGTTGTQRATFIAGISGVTVPSGIGVIVGTDGKLGTTTSSARFKEAMKPMEAASEALLALKPVTFRYKKELDPDGIPQFGLVAEQVEKVNPDLVARDEQGKPYTVRYEAVNAMLLNEFLKEHREVQEQKATIIQLKCADAKQEATIAMQQKQIEALTAGLQKVTAQLEASRRAPQLVNKSY